MAETLSRTTPEQRWRWFRNVNALGALGLIAAGVALPQYQTILFLGGAINGAQAAGAEIIRQRQAAKSV